MNKIKCAGIYKISIGEYYYIGMSVDIFSRLSSHYTQLKYGKHSSTKLQEKFVISNLNEVRFEILEYISLEDFKFKNKLKNKELDDAFRTFLLKKERNWMSKHSINYCLNKDDKWFS